jgi:hypothetical protein
MISITIYPEKSRQPLLPLLSILSREHKSLNNMKGKELMEGNAWYKDNGVKNPHPFF